MPIETIPDLLAAYEKNFVPERAVGIDGIIQLHITGEGGGDYHLVVRDQTLAINDGLHAAPSVTLTSSAKDWIDLSFGSVNPMKLMMTGRLKVKGSIPLATKFQGLFSRGK